MAKKAYDWQERRELRLKLIVFGLITWGIGCFLAFLLRDRNWLWGCYTFELCLLWPYKTGAAIETVSMALAVIGEALLWAGLLMGNRGEGRPAKDYRTEGVIKMVLGVILSVPYLLLVLPGIFADFGPAMMLTVFLGIGFVGEAVLGIVLIAQGVRCLRLAKKVPKIEERQGRVYYRAK